MNNLFEIPEGTDKIAVRCRLNRLLVKARENAKPQNCILCGQEKSSFCNSHSVPQMSLKHIADNGKIILASALIGFDSNIFDLETGVKKSGTFNYICRDCDNSFFKDYENPDSLRIMPTDKVLAEIAVKNMLQLISKRAVEKELIQIPQKPCVTFANPQDCLALKELDFKEFGNVNKCAVEKTQKFF